jgi:integrase
MRQSYYLRQRKASGLFSVIFIDPLSGKRTERATGTNDEKKAHALAQSWLAGGLPENPKIDNTAKTTIFCDYLYQFWDFDTSEYFKEQETMGKEPQPDHAYEMQRNVKRYYQPYFRNKLLCQIDEDSLQKFIVHLKLEKKLAASTVNSARNAAIKALRYAKRKKIIKTFDFENVLRAGGKPKERGILERNEAEKLFSMNWESDRSRMAALIAYNTGMRLGEIRALRICDIHENRITVRYSWSRKNNLKCTKNREVREVPILPWLYDEITSYIRQMKSLKIDGFLLPGKKPGVPYDSVQIRKDFQKMLEEIGIDDNTRRERGIVFHSWRHLLAKNLAEKGINKAIGMKILGHKTSRIFDHYASHVDKETFKQMTVALENVQESDFPRKPILFREIV